MLFGHYAGVLIQFQAIPSSFRALCIMLKLFPNYFVSHPLLRSGFKSLRKINKLLKTSLLVDPWIVEGISHVWWSQLRWSLTSWILKLLLSLKSQINFRPKTSKYSLPIRCETLILGFIPKIYLLHIRQLMFYEYLILFSIRITSKYFRMILNATFCRVRV